MGTAHQTAFETFYTSRMLERLDSQDTVDYEQALSVPTATESTETLQVVDGQRATGSLTFVNALDAETLAQAQLARMAYRHDDVTQIDDLRRTLEATPYPSLIKVGTGVGIYTEAVNRI